MLKSFLSRRNGALFLSENRNRFPCLRAPTCKNISSSASPVYLRDLLVKSQSIITSDDAEKMIKVEKATTTAISNGADYQCNSALRLAKQLKKPPKEIGTQLIEQLKDSEEFDSFGIKEVSLAGPGFINFRMEDDWLAKKALEISTFGVQPKSRVNEDILIDFGSPNMGKELHVGHLRSSVIGDTLANIYEFYGYDVHRVSHVGDMGSAIATLLAQLLKEAERRGCEDDHDFDAYLNRLTPTILSELYEMGKRELKLANNNPNFNQKVKDIIFYLQMPSADISALRNSSEYHDRVQKAFERTCEVSREGFSNLFSRLQVSVFEKGETSYKELLPDMINLFTKTSLSVESNGALCLFFESLDNTTQNTHPPMIIKKSDGAYLYATTDLACMYTRLFLQKTKNGRLKEILYVTDKSQELHFKMLFKAADNVGWLKDSDTLLKHVPFGVVQGCDGRKLSSRKGVPVSLEMLLNEAVERTKLQRSAIKFSSNTEKDKNDFDNDLMNEKIGCGAVRYFELSHQRERNYQFSFDNVLNMRGNTSIYHNYAIARLESILRNYNMRKEAKQSVYSNWDQFLVEELDRLNNFEFRGLCWNEKERQLLLSICQFEEELGATKEHCCPHVLCDYLYTVTTNFHSFYEACRILPAQEQDNNCEKISVHEIQPKRLFLCAATNAVLRRGLQLLGIQTVDRL